MQNNPKIAEQNPRNEAAWKQQQQQNVPQHRQQPQRFEGSKAQSQISLGSKEGACCSGERADKNSQAQHFPKEPRIQGRKHTTGEGQGFFAKPESEEREELEDRKY